MLRHLSLTVLSGLLLTTPVRSADPLHARIDRSLLDASKGKPVSPPADDGEFLRRATLDLAGTLPTADEVRAFLADCNPAKRTMAIDRLLASDAYPRRMADLFHVVLMERLGDHPPWTRYLEDAFRRNRPWDEVAREVLRAAPDGPEGASFFVAKRLENYGQNPVDYPALTRDVGRLLLGKDLRCAQCHDHLFVKEYRQEDFQGLFAFVQTAYLADPKRMTVGERPVAGKTAFMSVFTRADRQTGPRVPGGKEVAVVAAEKGKEYTILPDRKTGRPGVLRFSPLAALAREVPASPAFARTTVNRVWWALLGRGLVHPLDLDHRDNPPSHPELLALLATEFKGHKHDLKWLIREVVLTEAYGRSSRLPDGVDGIDPARFLTALEKPLSAEQLAAAIGRATGGERALPSEASRKAFVRAFAAGAREPEDEIAPSLKGALFLLNSDTVRTALAPKPGNLLDRLVKLPNDRVADELYVSVLTRSASPEERAEVAATLRGKSGDARTRALTSLAWALLASTEFQVNH